MQTQNPILDDLAHLASGAAGIASGIKAEVETQLRQRIERWLSELDLVPREEFETVKDMVAKARAEQETMTERLEALETRLAQRKGRRTSREANTEKS